MRKHWVITILGSLAISISSCRNEDAPPPTPSVVKGGGGGSVGGAGGHGETKPEPEPEPVVSPKSEITRGDSDGSEDAPRARKSKTKAIEVISGGPGLPDRLTPQAGGENREVPRKRAPGPESKQLSDSPSIGERLPKLRAFDELLESDAATEGAGRAEKLDKEPRRRKAKKKPKRRRPPPVEFADAEMEKLPPAPPTTPADPEPDPAELAGFENRAFEPERVVAQPMTETIVDAKSTFGIDVDTGGYTLARARLRDGYRPKPEDVRIEEFLNYFHYDYPEPKEGAFSVHLEAAPDPFDTAGKRHLIRIGVKGRAVPDAERPPAHLTFVIDVSGSMFGPDKLGLVIEALDLITRNLRADDTVAVVTYAMGAHVQLWPAGASERDLASQAIANLSPGGSTALDEGLQLAYEVAGTHFHAGHINRVVLLGDGRANVGKTTPGELLGSVASGVEDGVMLSTIGFGAKSFNDRVMEQLADRGNGSYFFVDSYREAQRVFGDRLCGTLFAIAEDVKIQVEFNPESVVRHRLLGYENRKIAHEQFRNDSVDAGEIGAGHSVTALYVVELTKQPAPKIASVNIRHKRPGEGTALETNYQLFSEEIRSDVRQASADFKFAVAVALFAQIARGDEKGSEARLSLVSEIASEGTPQPDHQPDRVEFVALVKEATPYYVN
jgi:Ca-activated chloride channel family protein